jgi:RND family efflux transporter MFP subunit
VAQPIEQEVTNYAEFTGNTVAFFTVDLRARVKGFLQSVNFQVSANVKKGDLLFVIEPEPYQAQVDQCKAELQAKEAQYKAAVDALAIKQEMYSKNAASKLDVISATDQRDTTQAQIAVAKAELEEAQINLGYTHVYAPISGRINRNLVDVGNLVGAGGEETLLATIVTDDPMYAYFNISERELLVHRAMRRARHLTLEDAKQPVELGMVTEEGFPHVGTIDYADNKLDPDTGTIQVRGVFPNADGALIPGLFVRTRVPSFTERAPLIPDTALGADQAGRFVLVVNEKNIVEYRRVKIGALFGAMRVIREGLTSKDWVIVNGLLRARPDNEVRPQRQKLSPAAAPAPAPAPPAGK